MTATAAEPAPSGPGPAEVVVEDAGWHALDIGALADRACRAALSHPGLAPGRHDVAVLACDDARIMELNDAFRGQRRPTNVLSWPSADRAAAEGEMPAPPGPEEEELGDIALARETCLAEAAAAGRPAAAHVTHLLVHGCLHLLGFDHVRDGDAALMERLETEILATLGLPPPYRDEPDATAR